MAAWLNRKWKVGDIFLVKTADGLGSVGQIIGQEKTVLNSVTCAFFDVRTKFTDALEDIPDLAVSQIFSVLFVTRESLDDEVWRVLGKRTVDISPWQRPYESLRKAGWIGAKVIGSGIVTEFINAFYALVPWDDWKDPNYLDRLLVSPEKKPRHLLFKR